MGNNVELAIGVGDPDAPALVYASGSGIPFYGQRRTRFLYIVTNTFRGGQAAAGVWQTTADEIAEYYIAHYYDQAIAHAAQLNAQS